jgi:putative spermidine/putrescine transport system ATP-binding protein
VIALRPERLVLGPASAGLENRVSGTVELVSYLGSSIDVHVRVSPADRVVVSQPNRADSALPKEGDRIDVGWSASAAVVLTGEDGAART